MEEMALKDAERAAARAAWKLKRKEEAAVISAALEVRIEAARKKDAMVITNRRREYEDKVASVAQKRADKIELEKDQGACEAKRMISIE